MEVTFMDKANVALHRPSYRMYIDESGNHDLKHLQGENQRFLALTGVIIQQDYYRDYLVPEMDRLKDNFFRRHHPDNPLVFHRKEIISGLWPFDELKDPMIRKEFDSSLLEYFRQWQYTVVTVCIDKKKHVETYTVWRHDPYHYCLAVLLERFGFFLRNIRQQGDVMAESRGRKENTRLEKAYSNIYKNGTIYEAGERFQQVLTTSKLKLVGKEKNIAGLQLSDLFAHPSSKQILLSKGLRTEALPLFAQNICDILTTKYYQGSRNIYGMKLL